MRALLALLVLGFGINSFASGRQPPPLDFKIHVWSCTDLSGGPDHGFGVGIDQTGRKGLVATVTTQSIMGPQTVGSWQVLEANPTVARGNTVYLDKATRGGQFKLTITPRGSAKFSAKDKRGNHRSGTLRCFRTRSL